MTEITEVSKEILRYYVFDAADKMFLGALRAVCVFMLSFSLNLWYIDSVINRWCTMQTTIDPWVTIQIQLLVFRLQLQILFVCFWVLVAYVGNIDQDLR